MEADGFYPIFMIWPTGPFDTYFEQVYKTNNGRYYYQPQPALGTLRMISDGLQGIARAPADWIYNTRRYYEAIIAEKCEFFVVDPAVSAAPDTPAADAELV